MCNNSRRRNIFIRFLVSDHQFITLNGKVQFIDRLLGKLNCLQVFVSLGQDRADVYDSAYWVIELNLVAGV